MVWYAIETVSFDDLWYDMVFYWYLRMVWDISGIMGWYGKSWGDIPYHVADQCLFVELMTRTMTRIR